MQKPHTSKKRVQIDKAHASLFLTIASAASIVVFSLVVSRGLLTQRSYQARVLKEKKTAAKQLKENLESVDTLVTSYEQFVGRSTNLIGGNPKGTADDDGDNAKLILDALPSKFDFPALASSMEKLLVGNGYKVTTILGVDDVTAQENTDSAEPTPVEIPITFGITGDMAKIQELLVLTQRSIRPLHVQTISITGDGAEIQVNVIAKTYFQPAKNLNIVTKEIK